MPHLAGLTRPSLQLSGADPRVTLDWMVEFTNQGMLDVEIRLFAEKLVRNVFPHDYLSEYATFENWVRTHIRYSRDPTTIEQVKTPRAVIETGTGDCDCLTSLLGTLCGTMGAKVRYVAGAFSKTSDGPIWSHVWCEAFDPTTKAWVVLDPVPGRRVAVMLDKLVDAMAVMAVA